MRVPAQLPSVTVARLRLAVCALALLPLARLVALGWLDRLGANPVEFVLRSLGTWTLVLLLVTLSVSPLRWLTGCVWLVRLRRTLGLFAFFYASLHLLAFVGLDLGFDLAAVLTEVLRRPYIAAGMTAYALLLPLALTSTDAMVRRLGARNWQRLHRLVYLAALAALLHYWWHKAGKQDFATVSIYAAVLAALLAARLLRWARARLRAPAGSRQA